MAGVIGIFTADSRAKILAQGGSGWWTMRVGRENEGFEYAVLFRKRISHQEDTHDVPHGFAFCVAKIANIRRNDRVFFEFSEVAWVDGRLALKWNGQQFPLSYQISLETLGFDPAKLDWQPVESSQNNEKPESDMGVFERHRLMISKETGIPVERIIIDVR